MDDEEIRYLGDVQKLVLGPSDALVLTVDKPITAELAKRLREHLSEFVGKDRKILILERGMSLGVLEQAV